VGGDVVLPAAQARHIVQVLRMKAGAPLTLFNGDGAEYAAVIARADKGLVSALIEGVRAVERESPLEVTLCQGVSRGERMDYTVQKAVELGVARIEPVTTSRGVVRLDAARARQKSDHWQAVAIGACEQCGRNRVPPVAPVVRLEDWLVCHRGGDAGTGILLDPDSGRGLAELPRPSGGVILLAGPEGGLADDERHDALRCGFVPVRLGPRVLRTETAALAALAAMQTLWGDF
jgi:16S rRNA (uracil1498-N3)-methyltransferase